MLNPKTRSTQRPQRVWEWEVGRRLSTPHLLSPSGGGARGRGHQPAPWASYQVRFYLVSVYDAIRWGPSARAVGFVSLAQPFRAGFPPPSECISGTGPRGADVSEAHNHTAGAGRALLLVFARGTGHHDDQRAHAGDRTDQTGGDLHVHY